MSINDLELILKKDPIISTWPARSLVEDPVSVERDYLVHARTHLSLGDTAKYVDTIFKWVSGVNKGTFIGGVLGDYGQGKTSFLVHVWAQSRDRKVFVVPPFEWSAFEEIVDAIAGWAHYSLKASSPGLTQRLRHIHEGFKQETAESLARTTAQDTRGKYEETLATVRALVSSGAMRLREMSAARLLAFVAKVTEVVREAGYEGLLVLLDEPEVAAKQLGNDTVQHFLFSLANELHHGQGNYGVFLSMPANFYASAQARFSALTARLEVCSCFPRLGDIYGPGFAHDLWSRYVSEFGLGKEGQAIVSDAALTAIGQVGASENRELAYGPRSVVSAFRRMVEYHQPKGEPYSPLQFVQDVLDDEIMVAPDYRSRVFQTLRSSDVNPENEEAIRFLAAFPSGLQTATLRELGYEEVLRPLARSNGIVYRTAFSMGLRPLRSSTDPGGGSANQVRDMVEEIDSEFAPGRTAFSNALKAFAREIAPRIFPERKGQQLNGWQWLCSPRLVAQGAYFGTMLGAFQQMSRRFPYRAAMLVCTSTGAPIPDANVPDLDPASGPSQYDLLFHFAFRWDKEQPLIANRVELGAEPDKLRVIRVNLDLTAGTLQQEHLAEAVGAERLTPLWVLNLLQRMSKVELDRHHEAEWQALKGMLVDRLVAHLLDSDFSEALAEAIQNAVGERVSGFGLTMLDQATTALLTTRYPSYATLIRQPHWQSRIDGYVNALANSEVPLRCKRGSDVWAADTDQAARVLGTGRMNLTGGGMDDLDSLIEVKSLGRNQPLAIYFRTHPLEQKIRDLICSQPTGPSRKLKRDGKECWYMPQSALIPFIRNEGYTAEELMKIVAIGRARGSFDVTEHRGERVLFCAPINPDELKDQLRAKLRDLRQELEEYRQIPDFVSSFDCEWMTTEIESVQDDADYERLLTRLNKEFESNHSRLPGYFDRLKEGLTQLRNEAVRYRDQLSGSREMQQLGMPSSKSPWGADLGRYIVPNLQQVGDDVRKGMGDLIKRLDTALARYAHSRQRPPSENLALLCEGWSTRNDLEGDLGTLQGQVRSVLQQVAEYQKWLTVLRESDALCERLIKLQRDPGHKQKADALIASFDDLSQRVSDHIQVRNVTGLSGYGQFVKELQGIEQERQRYWGSLKEGFDQTKERVNQLFVGFRADARVAVGFNSDDIGGCYAQLFCDGARLLHERVWDQILNEITTQERELNYARDVLRAVDDDSVSSLLDLLCGMRERVAGYRAQTSEEWLKTVVEVDDGQNVKAMIEDASTALGVIREARQRVAEATRPSPPESHCACLLHGMIPEVGRSDLKDLVLSMMSEADGPTKALDASLEALAELFRHNCIQIIVERRQR